MTEYCPFCDTLLEEHPANRCLDAWVEKARGYDVARRADVDWYGVKNMTGEFAYRHEGMVFGIVWHSSEWEFAGDLMEEMAEAGLWPALHISTLGSAWVDLLLPNGDMLVLRGNDAPEAIARAYIAWRMTEGEKGEGE